MTHYINTLTGDYPVTFEQLRAQYPQTMFPQDFAGDFEHFAPVSMDDYPAYDAATHKVAALARSSGGTIQINISPSQRNAGRDYHEG